MLFKKFLISALALGLAALCSAPSFAQPQTITAKANSTVFQLDMRKAESQGLKIPDGAAWVREGKEGETVLKMTVSSESLSEAGMLTIPLDVSSLRGKRLALTCQAKADNVTKPQQPYLGIKCMLNIKTPSGQQWFNPNNVYGTFDWKLLAANVPVPDEATQARLMLGIQGSTGTVWFGDVKIVATGARPVRPPLPDESAVLPPAYKGHNLPRLRGMMSPNEFREEDFAEMAKWNINLVRWQMGRYWGKERQDRDLADYDRWLDGKLDELAKVLDTAQRYGMKIVVDLHGPPGGREADKTMAMFLEKPYQDHFVEVWKKIATRFKGHPAVWGYDLVNEPVQNQPSPDGVGDWLGAQVRAAQAVRAIDPDTTIIFEVDNWDSPASFAWLEAVKIPNVIYQVHMYVPGEYTHQGVHNSWGESGTGKLLGYPSKINGVEWNKEALRRTLQPVRDFQRAYNVHIYVGEFSAIRWAPGADQYLSDCIDIFEEYGWDWTYHAFREWPGWSVEHADLPADSRKHPKATEDTARAKVLKLWFAKNMKARAE